MNINKALVCGNLTREVELKSLPSGMKVASISIATNRKYSVDGQKKEAVEFHNVIAFGKIAETLGQYCKKGDGLFVEGRIQTRNWEDKDGKKNYRTEIVVENFQFGNKAKVEEPKEGLTSGGTKVPDFSEVDISDLPF
jgi:single-strand DNA-binding protein